MPTDVKWLRPEELELYLDACYCIENHLDKMPKAEAAKEALASLARRAELLDRASECLAPGSHKLHDEIAAELAGLPREITGKTTVVTMEVPDDED